MLGELLSGAHAMKPSPPCRAVRDTVIESRLPQEGEPVVSDVFIDEGGDPDQLQALCSACRPVWNAMGRP